MESERERGGDGERERERGGDGDRERGGDGERDGMEGVTKGHDYMKYTQF